MIGNDMKTISGTEKKYAGRECIWITSELVSYKLCDKNYDCEHCEFDKVIRNLSAKLTEEDIKNDSQSGNLIERIIKRIEKENFSSNIIYLQNQLVIKNLFGDVYYIGINPVVHYLLDDFSYLRDFNSRDIKREQIIFTIEGNWGIKQFISPINFSIIEKINFSHFTLNRWYAIILLTDNDVDKFRINETEWNEKKDAVIKELNSKLINVPAVGPCLNDGGEKINFLHHYLGRREYLKLLNNSFK